MTPSIDAWLRGPVPGVPPLLQPAAHALVQAREDIRRLTERLRADALHARPGDSASIAFHLFHVAGATDRLFTYARNEPLTEAQRAALREEREGVDSSRDTESLVRLVETTLDRALAQLAATPEAALLHPRTIGAAQLPTTVIGLLFHGAEHATRHTGQISTLTKLHAFPPGALDCARQTPEV